MKHVHKFRLVPVDQAVANVAALEEKMQQVLHDRKLPADARGAIYEDLTAKRQNLKSEIDAEVPAVRVVDTSDDQTLIPKYRLPARAANLWRSIPQLRTNSSNEIVLNGHVLPGTDITRALDFATGKKKAGSKPPVGYEYVRELLSGLQPTRRIRSQKMTVPKMDTTSDDSIVRPSPRRLRSSAPRRARVSKSVTDQLLDLSSTQEDDSTQQEGDGRKQKLRKRLYIKLWHL